jgi:hypothetical protein
MTWCKDIPRDAAVRAAEDGRDWPLPTLAEAIARPFSDAAERSSTVSETGDGQSGIRTERVTLEVKHFSTLHAQQWGWGVFAEPVLRPGESVRVVEEAHFDDLAQVAMERDAAIREREKLRGEITSVLDRAKQVRSEHDALRARVAELEARNVTPGEGSCAAQAARGPEQQNVSSGSSGAQACDRSQNGRLKGASGGALAQIAEAFGCQPDDDDDLVEAARLLVRERDEAVAKAAIGGGEQPRGWLTGEEREALRWVCSITPIDKAEADKHFAALRNLRRRSSPPEVVLPNVYDYIGLRPVYLRADVVQALAAAGVAVKEVPNG